MAKTAQQIANDINAHIKNSYAKKYSDFYIGITNDIERRLFGEHSVPKKGHWFIYSNATNDEHARSVEKHYLDKGMKGGDGGGDNSSTYVYCYEISNSTKE